MPPGQRPKKRVSNEWFTVWTGAALHLAFGVALIASLINLWPSIERATASTTTVPSNGPIATVHLFFGLITVQVTANTALLLLVVLVGALGSVIHAATSFGDFVGNRRFYSSWAAWYLLRPVIGASLAVLLYFAFRGGFFSGSSQANSINPYGIAALAGLAGLFSKQATDKLREVFETMFHVSSKGDDAQRKDNLANPTPVLSSADPTHLTVGAANPTLTLHGEHFSETITTARIGGVAVETTVSNSQSLVVEVPDELVASPQTLTITIFNGPPGGGSSQALLLPVIT
jgi:hypothetical protein